MSEKKREVEETEKYWNQFVFNLTIQQVQSLDLLKNPHVNLIYLL